MAAKHDNSKQMTKAQCLFLVACTGALTMFVGCSPNPISVPTSPQVARDDRSFVDLQPGTTIRIVVPLLKSGQYRSDLVEQQSDGHTITMRAADLIGYTNSSYLVTGKVGSVRLKFVSAEETRDGKAVALAEAPKLPFELPGKAAHVRLVFLVRVSQADHNMAILSAKRAERLDAFTKELVEDPGICKAAGDVFCAWVPAGVAVRPEK